MRANDVNLRLRLCSTDLNVHLNMIEQNNGENRFAAERFVSASGAVTRARKLKLHNTKLYPLAIRERIVNALAAGDSKAQIARAPRVSRHTVSAVAEQGWLKVEQRKARIAAQSECNITRAAELIAEKLEKENVPLSTLVPVFGVSVDKAVPLRGDPSVVARIEHVPSGNIFDAFQKSL